MRSMRRQRTSKEVLGDSWKLLSNMGISEKSNCFALLLLLLLLPLLLWTLVLSLADHGTLLE